MVGLAYVLPIVVPDEDARDPELAPYLRALSETVDELIVVDGSPRTVFLANADAWACPGLLHVAPDPSFAAPNGKVAAVRTGVRLSRQERIVVADDDVRHTAGTLESMRDRLAHADLVWPQNHFDPAPWHARWDTARTLINRAVGFDYPGTVGVRRSSFQAMGGYRGDVLFENLELLRRVRATKGRVCVDRGLYVARRPPTVTRFLTQRVRQAYDSHANPGRALLELAVVPFVVITASRRDRRPLLAAAALAIGLAERGRRRAGGAAVFPATASLWAPLWLLERGVCAWFALGSRFRGGVRYAGSRIKTAATPAFPSVVSRRRFPRDRPSRRSRVARRPAGRYRPWRVAARRPGGRTSRR